MSRGTPRFQLVIDVHPESYVLQPFAWFFGQYAPVRAGTANGAAYDARGAIVTAQYYYLWPNITLSTNPGHPNLVLYVWLPDGPEHTRGFTERYFGPDVPEDFVQQMSEFSRQVGIEDQALTTSVQLGLRAGLPEQGQLLHKSEQLVIRFQKLVLRALAGEHVYGNEKNSDGECLEERQVVPARST